MADELTINVLIDDKDLATLQNSNFKLCLTKGVAMGGKERDGNVVFSTVPTDKLGPKLEFTWQEQYRVYEMIEFVDGAKCKADTHVYPLEGGQTALFDKKGIATITGAADVAQPLEVENDWKNPACIAVQSLDTTTQKFSTIFVSPKLPMYSLSQLTPVRKYKLFFDMNLATETMFMKTGTKPFSINLTGKASITVRYKDSAWKVVKDGSDDSVPTDDD